MAVAEGGYGVWAVRLAQANQALQPEARWLSADVGGPFYSLHRMANSDIWGGTFAELLQRAIRHLDDQLAGCSEHLWRLGGSLEQAVLELENAARLEAVGLVSHFDVLGALAPWRRWPSASPLPLDWAGGGQHSAEFVWVYPDRARQLAEGLRTTAGQLGASQRRVANALSPVGIDTPLFLNPITEGLEDIATEIDRRVTLLEQVDRELAGAFRDLAAGLGFPGSLAPPQTFDPVDPLGSSLAGLRAGPDVGPGRQPAQVQEADPVSTSTGNYLYEAVDLAQPARGFPTVFTRTYNSLRTGIDVGLGFGWTHSLGTHLSVEDGGGVTLVWGDGREERHDAGSGGLPPSPQGRDRLRRSADGFELASRAGILHRFDAGGRLLSMTDRTGHTSTLEYRDGRLAGVVDASHVVTAFEHDDAGRITAVVGVLGRRWTYTYSRAGDLAMVTDPEGGITSYRYDDHLLVSITDPEGARVVHNSYDGLGRVIQQRNGAGGRWRYRYEAGRTLVTDPFGHVKAFQFDDRYRTTAVTDPNGATTEFRWDESSNLVAAADPIGRTVRFAYGEDGRLISAEKPGTAPVRFDWDSQGNLIGVGSADGHRTEFSWDDANRLLRFVSAAGIITTIAWRSDGLPESVSSADGGTTRYDFDDAGRLASTTDPLGAITLTTFDLAGRLVTETHPGGGQTAFTWDRCDRLLSVTDEAGASHRYTYDRCGRLATITDPLGRISRYAYDPFGLLASATDPLGRKTTFVYDACGRLTSRTDPRGNTVSLSYDPAGRLIRIDSPDANPVVFGWDDADHLVSMVDATGQTTWDLDEAARPIVEHRPDAIELLHAYDTLGRRRRIELRQAGTTIGAWEQVFDPDGRVTGVRDPSGGTTSLGYDPAGRLASLHHPNGVTTTWTYDRAGQPIGLSHESADGTVLSAWTQTFDADGNLVRSERSPGDPPAVGVHHYGYDRLGRLIAVTNSRGTATFSWDAASNLTAMGDNGALAEYDQADQLTSLGHRIYRHDQAGNLLEARGGAEPVLTCDYNALGQIFSIRAGRGTATFSHDGLGRRVTRTTSEESTTRIYDGASVVAEIAPDGTAALETTAGLLVLHRQGPSGRAYLHADPNTNVSVVTDDTGAVLATFVYEPFGTRHTAQGDREASAPLGFCGTLGVREEFAGLIDMRARLYDPGVGRFISPDPWPAYLPEPVTLNRYLYALGDPLAQVDPFGLFCWTGKHNGKCRGFKDVVTRVGDMAEEPLGMVGKVSTGVAAVAAGVSLYCPPCIPVSGPIALVAGKTALWSGWAAAGATCAKEWSATDFNCWVGVSSSLLGSVARPLSRYGFEALGLHGAEGFARGIFGVFRAGVTTAANRMNK